MESTNAFNIIYQKLNKAIAFIEDENKRSSEIVVKTIKYFIAIWNKKVVEITLFSERGRLLILILKLLDKVHLHTIYDGTRNENNESEVTLKEIHDFSEIILKDFAPETFKLLNYETLQDPNSLSVFQEVLLQLVTVSNILTLPQIYQVKTCNLIFELAIQYKSQLNSCSDNKWMENFVAFLCSKIKFHLAKLFNEPEDAKTTQLLRYYNIKLINFSKTFANEAFHGTKHVIQLLFSVYKLRNCSGSDKITQMIQMNAIVPLLGFLESVQVNEELISAICECNEDTTVVVSVLLEIVKIVLKNRQPAILNQYFGDHLEENLFEILFEAVIQSDKVMESVLSPLVVCLTLASSYKKAYQAIIIRLTTALLSEKLSNALWSLNIWIFIARISSQEVCYQYFKQFRNVFLIKFPPYTTSMQKYFIGKVMSVFYLCLKSKDKQKVIEDNDFFNEHQIWSELGLSTLNEYVEDIYYQTDDFILDFFKTKTSKAYYEMLKYFSLCSLTLNNNYTPTENFYKAVDEISEFLDANTSNVEPFIPLVLIMLQLCENHIEKINITTITNTCDFLKNLINDKKTLKIIKYRMEDFINKSLKSRPKLSPKVPSIFKQLLETISEKTVINETERAIRKSGYLLEDANSSHVCRVPSKIEVRQVISNPLMKKRKFETNPNVSKKEALKSLENFERELSESGLFISIPQLKRPLGEIKSLLS